jgi:putative DNA primase/helicase
MKKRFASMQEPNDNDTIYTGAMKEYTGGDKIYSRGLFSSPTPFKPQFKLVLLCNKMPTIKGWDYGTWRRIRVVNFNSSFVDNPNPLNGTEYKKDRQLSTRFDKWKEAFMWLLLQYLAKYKKNGISEPMLVLNASKAYKKKSDMYFQFIDETFEQTGNESDKFAISQMYEGFKMWWKNSIGTGSMPIKNDLLDYISSNTKIHKLNKTHFNKLILKNQEEFQDM